MTNNEGLTMYTQNELEDAIRVTGNVKFWMGVIAGGVSITVFYALVIVAGLYYNV